MALGLSRLFGLNPTQTTVLLAFSALPTASTCYVLAAPHGLQRAVCGGLGHAVPPWLACSVCRLRWACCAADASALNSLAQPANQATNGSGSRPRTKPLALAPPHRCARHATPRPSAKPHALQNPRAVDASALPAAKARLRSQRAWPMRRMALPSVRRKNSASLQAIRSAMRPAPKPSRDCQSGKGLSCANLFQGQASWQSSQTVDAVANQRTQRLVNRPGMLESSDKKCSAARPTCRARRWPGWGTGPCRAVHWPQCADVAGVSGRAQVHKQLAPEKTSNPPRGSAPACVCLANPTPLRVASSASMTGAESVNTRWPKGPIASAMRSCSFCRRERKTLW